MALPDFFATGKATPVSGNRNISLAADGSLVLPAGILLRRIYFKEKNGAAVTGGIRVGTSAAGTQVVTAQAIAANAVVSIIPTIENYQAAAQTLYIEAVTSWNGAAVDVCVQYEEITTRTQPTSNTINA